MYSFYFENKKAEKRLDYYKHLRKDIISKLERLRVAPRQALDAHPLGRELQGLWSCWLGSNIRMIYEIDDLNKRIIIHAAGTHKIY